MKDRILEFLRRENKTSSQFADEIGVQASSVSHIISGRNKPSLDFIIKMLQQYEDLSTDWLIFGKGEMFSKDSVSDIFSESVDSSNKELKSIISDSSVQDSVNELVKTTGVGDSELNIKAGSGIQRVILVYSDNTFRELNPS